MQYFGIRDLREKIGDYAHEADSGVMTTKIHINLVVADTSPFIANI